MAAHTVTAADRPPRPRPLHGMRGVSHDPYRARRGVLRVPQLPSGAVPVDRPVTVLALVDRYPPTVNAGAEWYLHCCLRDSVARGHRAIVATATRDPYRYEGVDVVPHRGIDQYSSDVDVAVGHLLWTRALIQWAERSRVPVVYVAHNDQQVRHWRLGPANVTVLVSNAEWVAARHSDWGGPHVVVRPPVLVDDYKLDRDPATAEYVTLVNCHPAKGSDVFYALAAARRDLRFLAVEGAYGQQQRPGPGDRNVTWQPQTPSIRDDVYRRTRVLLMPSSYESWGRVAVEASASGIPVVAHPTPGLQEALGPAGLFCDRDDLAAWLDALARMDDPAGYRAASDAARDRAAKLDGQSRRDLDTWDHTLRLAAAAAARKQE